MSRVPWIERGLQLFSLAATVFVTFYMITYVAQQRQVSDCRAAVDKAVIISITAGRDAGAIEADAMDHLVSGFLLPGADARTLLSQYQQERRRAADIRIDNPLPSADC